MKRSSLVIAALALLLVPTMAPSQMAGPAVPVVPPVELTPGGAIPVMPLPFQPPGFFGAPGRRMEVYAKAGFQWMAFDASFPVLGVNPATSVRVFESMDLQLRDGNVWVGFLGLRVRPTPNLTLYAEYGRNALRDAIIKMGAAGRATDPPPALDANLISPWEWTAAGFRWWMLDTGVAWSLSELYSLEFGFHMEHIDFQLKDPRNDTERFDIDPPIVPVPGRAITAQRLCPTCNGTIEGDPLSKVWFPYIGISGTGRCCKWVCCPSGQGQRLVWGDPNYRWRLRGSPIAWNRWISNVDFRVKSPPGAFPEAEITRTTHRLDANNGKWIEGEFEAFLNITPAMKASLWTRGSWLSLEGTGQMELDILASTIISEARLQPLEPGDMDIQNASYTQSLWSFGAGLYYTF